MIDERTQAGARGRQQSPSALHKREPLNQGEWAELQQIADQRRGAASPAPVTACLDDLLAPSISHLRPVAEALLQEMRGNR